MSIELYASNALESLADKLSENLKEDKFDVFTKPYIVTQTEGINSWLKIRLAEKLGIISNVAMVSPTDVISRVFSALGGGIQQTMHSEYLKWLIFEMLSEKDFAEAFPKISSYFADSESKRLSLAKKTADLFDQYQIYRPEKITEWSNGIPETDADLQWQSYLWHKIKTNHSEQLGDKTEMAQKIIELLNDEKHQQALVKKIPRLYFFGMAIITPFYLKLFYALSQHIPVRFYLINPSPETYWMEDVTEKRMTLLLNRNKKKSTEDFTIGNELLLNWGKIINDSFTLLFHDDGNINSYDDSLRTETESPATLLQKIQSDIYNNAAQDSRHEITEADASDGSVTINASFTAFREVEILYNYLIQLIDEKKTVLSPRDIVVMVNDVDKYAPFINAVFDNAPYKIPFSIADESLSSGNNFFSALVLLLAMEENEFTSERVVELLENKYIRKRFGISNIPLIRKAMAEANIIFGVTGSVNNDTRFMSWEYGLRKIVLGLCISGGENIFYKNEAIQPIDTIEGDDSFEMIRFHHFANILIQFINERKNRRSLAEWINYLKSLAEEMVFESATGEDDDYHVFIKQLEKLETAAELVSGDIEFDTFRMAFEETVSYEKRGHSFLRGGITFCSFIPMRSIPFKVVCLLGLDFDKFPRKENPLSFSLFNKGFLKGDRNVKDNDKHLFLETILSAKEFLYMSYIGSNIKDGKPIPPSALLDEFIDYVEKGVKQNSSDIRKKLVNHHPLQGFSQRYFNQSGLVSYLSHENYKTNEEGVENTTIREPFDFTEIDIKDLRSFMKNPVRFYFSKVLKVYYSIEEVLLPENEKFELNNLDEWIVSDEWLKRSDNDLYAFTKEKIKKGDAPLHNFGLVKIEAVVEAKMLLKESLMQVIGQLEERKLSGSIEFGDTVLSGFIDSVYGKTVLGYNHSKKLYGNFLDKYVGFVFARACGHEVDFTFFYTWDPPQKYVITSTEMPEALAKEKLSTWIKMYKKGFEKLFPFYPDFEKPLDYVSGDWNYFISKVESQFENEFGGRPTDAYYKAARDNGFFDESNFESFKENTINILGGFNFK
jgi:exodeoxyribonuclease V gamma subunit